jgi:hypothetical protein
MLQGVMWPVRYEMGLLRMVLVMEYVDAKRSRGCEYDVLRTICSIIHSIKSQLTSFTLIHGALVTGDFLATVQMESYV